MLVSETKIRVYYEDTDQMGIVYYGNYARYYEIGRTEMIRQMGFTYKQIEEQKIALPARSLNITYIKSAYYDDLLTIRTIIDTLPKVKFPIKTEIYNQHGELINKGETVLVFFNALTNKPCAAPDFFIDKMKEFF
ncbi:MAG: thioesterase [Bacteroidetes bacterium GWF2_42_66]|nr:MAG: thioesterase [Bacteroidetes bacterium GWA2_42_15]OFY03538.1 MAG: thioesterase [Bacteroidetes bacterium GWE2_42_39]OFY45903.1 MAG: thioesterase [Bacteroidetes bacterium GWF2_42_66]HBL75145.1 thioesterase [Prolixibacteraceae bacterium]HCR91614.1 thioesterase [Prolixibacteraceae bacterium]